MPQDSSFNSAIMKQIYGLISAKTDVSSLEYTSYSQK